MRNIRILESRFFHFILLALAAGYLAYSLTPYGISTTVDSLSYLHAARSFAEGNGIRVPDTDLASGLLEKTMTWWPPLYPLALSPFTVIQTLEQGARVFNWMALLAYSFVFLLLISRYKPRILGLAGGLWLMLLVPTLTIYTYAWSETLFLPLALASYLLAARYWERRDPRILILATAFLIATCYTRYIGTAFILPFLGMIWFSERSLRDRIFSVGLSGGLLAAALIGLALRNMHYSGSATGLVRAESGHSLLETLELTGNLLGMQLLGRSSWGLILLLLSTLAGICLYLLLRVGKNDADSVRKAVLDMAWPYTWAACYLGTVILLRTWKDFDLDTRMLAPVTPFLAIAVLGTVIWLRGITQRAWVVLPFVAWAVLLILLGSASYASALTNLRMNMEPGFLSDPQTRYGNISTYSQFGWMAPIYEKLDHRFHRPVVIIDNYRPIVFAYFTGAGVKALPDQLDATTVERINLLVNGVILLTTVKGEKVLETYYGKSIEHLRPLPEFLSFGFKVIPLPLPVAQGTTKKSAPLNH